MKYLKLLILLTAVLGLCALQPTTALAQGGTEIVLCLDVSGSINLNELQTEVDGLKACLNNSTILPQNGQVSVAIVIYATNSSTILPILTPITLANLQNIINPKLDSLRNNIISIRANITGTLTNIAAGLLDSRAVLQGGSAQRQFVLLVGDGQSTDPKPSPSDSTQAACDSLALDGTTVCVIAVSAPPEGEAELKACADATGGEFGSTTFELSEFTKVCEKCLRFIFEIILEPEVATNPVGSLHTLTATVTDSATGDPLEDANVTFQIIDGVNVNFDFGFGPGTIGRDTTDANGIATIDYTSFVTGTDTIEAFFITPTGVIRRSSQVTKIWQLKTVTLTPLFASNPINTPHTLTANVQVNGVPQVGVTVDFTVRGANAAVAIPSATTNASGDASTSILYHYHRQRAAHRNFQ